MKLKKIWWYFFNKEKYHYYIILCWLKRAKKYYIKRRVSGMCASLMITASKGLKFANKYAYSSYEDFLRTSILGYNPERFNTHRIEEGPDCGYWWPYEDRESRIKAFDQLISDYEELCVQ